MPPWTKMDPIFELALELLTPRSSRPAPVLFTVVAVSLPGRLKFPPAVVTLTFSVVALTLTVLVNPARPVMVLGEEPLKRTVPAPGSATASVPARTPVKLDDALEAICAEPAPLMLTFPATVAGASTSSDPLSDTDADPSAPSPATARF